MVPSKIKIESFAKRYNMGTLGGKGLNRTFSFIVRFVAMKFSHDILHTYCFILSIIKHNLKIGRFWVVGPRNSSQLAFKLEKKAKSRQLSNKLLLFSGLQPCLVILVAVIKVGDITVAVIWVGSEVWSVWSWSLYDPGHFGCGHFCLYFRH